MTPKVLFHRFLPGAASIVAALGAWELSSRWGLLDATFFPRPTAIGARLAGMLIEGTLLRDVYSSVLRVLWGLVVGGIPGAILGIVIARVRAAYHLLYPLVVATYPLPKIALIPFVILLFGYGELSKVVIVSLGAFYLVLLNTYRGVSGIDAVHFEIARVGRYRRLDRWRYIVLPGALPSIFHGFRLAAGICLILIVAAEFVGSTSGIGYRIWISWEMFQIEQMFAALFVLAGLGWLFHAALIELERICLPWRKDL